MSKKETQNADQTPEKVMTKYDLKMQRRKEEKEKEERSRRTGNLLGIAIVVVLVCIVASFPIRNYLTVHGTYVKVNGEKISKVEFDYNYNVAVSNYLSQYGYYLYMMGLDPSTNFTSQMYSENLTWGDYFEELAIQNIARNKGMYKQGKEEGFAYDVTEEYQRYEDSLEKAASEAGSAEGAYLKELYGAYATSSRIKPFVQEAMYVAAYYDEVAERSAPGQEEIQAYYEENKASYDSVDYYMLTVDAELPTEPTELADPVEEPEEGEGEAEGNEETEEAYQPSEAEIEAAMKEAKAKADKAEKTLQADTELRENEKQSAVSYNVREWLFDEERKAGETTVIEDASSHRYYVVGFEKRYLDEVPSVDVRVAMTTEDNGQVILDEWKGGAATEESFAEICDKYNDPEVTTAQGGLLEALVSGNMPEEVSSWTHDAARVAGDTAVISPESEENTYVLYYVGTNEPEWALSIRQTLINEKMAELMTQFVDNAQVEDPKGHLRYLTVQEEESQAASEDGESQEDAQAPEDGESRENPEDAGGQEDSDASEDGESSESSADAEGQEGSDAS